MIGCSLLETVKLQSRDTETKVATYVVKNFKQIATRRVSNRNRSAERSALQWHSVYTFEYKKSEPETIYFRDMRSSKRRRKLRNMKCYQLMPAYTSKVPIARLRYIDLINLCKKEHHSTELLFILYDSASY